MTEIVKILQKEVLTTKDQFLIYDSVELEAEEKGIDRREACDRLGVPPRYYERAKLAVQQENDRRVLEKRQEQLAGGKHSNLTDALELAFTRIEERKERRASGDATAPVEEPKPEPEQGEEQMPRGIPGSGKGKAAKRPRKPAAPRAAAEPVSNDDEGQAAEADADWTPAAPRAAASAAHQSSMMIGQTASRGFLTITVIQGPAADVVAAAKAILGRDGGKVLGHGGV